MSPRGSPGVRAMFARIAPRYDLLNHLLSFNRDRYWRACTVDRLRPILQAPGSRVLDLCCGTGDLLLALEGERGGPVAGTDFCHPMLVLAQGKLAQKHFRSALFESDALALPLPDGCLDLITMAFGIRNLSSYRQGLAEALRVLRPSGTAAILEFSQPPKGVVAALYGFYSRRILPAVGSLLSGDRAAYHYLPDSVSRFPSPEQVAEQMRQSGFVQVDYERLSGGIVALHTGRAPGRSPAAG